ncbi:hypothetical protein B0T25DRAFT_563165 [Lasiosphaeria hispida]|uniref:Uncharacterized protein n=1 Tax=Lasiosphaeria hispida TaxID=260671 RepID=A0AAJ0HWK4_9PEZI|nr:hypothetical protein B0T25DRAFT_563165 [Lasiosphaeria hispida]
MAKVKQGPATKRQRTMEDHHAKEQDRLTKELVEERRGCTKAEEHLRHAEEHQRMIEDRHAEKLTEERQGHAEVEDRHTEELAETDDRHAKELQDLPPVRHKPNMWAV